MKRILSLIILVAVLLTVLAVSASAMTKSLALAAANSLDTQNYTFAFNDNYPSNQVPYSHGVVFYYSYGTGQKFANTTANVPAGGKGWVFTLISYNVANDNFEPVTYTAQCTDIENGQLSASAFMQIHNSATRTNHFASLTANGNTNAWDYYFTSPNHYFE